MSPSFFSSSGGHGHIVGAQGNRSPSWVTWLATNLQGTYTPILQPGDLGRSRYPHLQGDCPGRKGDQEKTKGRQVSFEEVEHGSTPMVETPFGFPLRGTWRWGGVFQHNVAKAFAGSKPGRFLPDLLLGGV